MSPPDAGPQPGASGDAIRSRIATAMVQIVGSRGYEATALEAVCAPSWRAWEQRSEDERAW